MQGAKSYVTDQWRAFVLSDFDAMSQSIKAFYRQAVNSPLRTGQLNSQNDIAARAWIAFDPARKNITKIQISDIEVPLQEMRDVWQPSWGRP